MGAQSKIFVRKVTALDCAVLFPRVGPRGRSWHVDICWEGDTDAHGVVFDFSLAKKAGKQVIDDLYDHRLWIPHSQVNMERRGRISAFGSYCLGKASGPFAIETYPQSVCVMDDATIADLEAGNTTSVAKALAQDIQSQSPNTVKSVQVTLGDDGESQKPHFFSYTHSLRTHFGNCQRFHGHGNIIESFHDGVFQKDKSIELATALDGRYLISPHYLCSPHNDEIFDGLLEELSRRGLIGQTCGSSSLELAFVRYQGSQGQVSLILPRSAVVLMTDEPTIENIAAHVRFSYVNHSIDLGGCEIRAFEGLGKGAVSP